MNRMLSAHLWKLAVVLALAVLVILRWQQNNNLRPVVPDPTVVDQAGLVQPSPTPDQGEPAATVAGLRPTATPSPRPPTVTPTALLVFHTVKQGEYPLSIATFYGISADTLLEANQITDPTKLQIGQELLVPVTATSTSARPTATPTPYVPPTPTPEPLYHVVESGDTLSAIAAEHETRVKAIVLANELSDPGRLQVGQELLIPQNAVSFDSPTAVHKISSGDTLGRLALRYGSTVEDLLGANPNLEPTTLQVGQQIIVPITSPPINPEADPWLPQITTPEDSPANIVTVQQQMIEEVNARRDQNGLSALLADADLARIALAHAQDMVKRGYFAHVTPDGVSLRNRFEQQGLEADWVGENIQRNTKPQAQTAAEAIYWFMNSAPHRANILHKRFNRLGVGVVEEPPGWHTIVLVFAQR
jgi:uncharacterized protein YkwD/nucleoid-associated protein YgaU